MSKNFVQRQGITTMLDVEVESKGNDAQLTIKLGNDVKIATKATVTDGSFAYAVFLNDQMVFTAQSTIFGETLQTVAKLLKGVLEPQDRRTAEEKKLQEDYEKEQEEKKEKERIEEEKRAEERRKRYEKYDNK